MAYVAFLDLTYMCVPYDVITCKDASPTQMLFLMLTQKLNVEKLTMELVGQQFRKGLVSLYMVSTQKLKDGGLI